MKTNEISVLIADDHSLMRQGLKQILELESDIQVIGQAADGLEALDQVQKLKPDVVLLDINMPKLSGIEVLRRLRDLGVGSKVIMLTIHDDREYLYETINIGANGYVLKDSDADGLIRAIKNVHMGESYIQPNLVSQFVRNYSEKENRTKEDIRKDSLTRREYEVLTLIADGMNNREIAEKLFISEKTVKNHVSNIFKKIDVTDRIQAAIFAFKNNIKKI